MLFKTSFSFASDGRRHYKLLSFKLEPSVIFTLAYLPNSQRGGAIATGCEYKNHGFFVVIVCVIVCYEATNLAVRVIDSIEAIKLMEQFHPGRVSSAEYTFFGFYLK